MFFRRLPDGDPWGKTPMSRTLPEPWRVKVVEKIQLLPREERERLLVEGGFSLFKIPSEAVFIDLFTDSGTSAMSDWQWAGMMQGDEAYAGARNFFHLQDAIRDVFGFPAFLPVHQGRVAENLLFSTVLTRPGMTIPNNCHVDTSRANIEVNGGVALDLVIPEGRDSQANHPFKGNMDLLRLRRLLVEESGNIPLCMLTLTNNSGRGPPGSPANVRATAELCRECRLPSDVDACSFAKNDCFIHEIEQAQALSVALYREGGIRGVEIGSVMFGSEHPETGEPIPAPMELIRLAVPRRVFTNSHLEYVAGVLEDIRARRHTLRGLRMTYAPKVLRHFTARFEELEAVEERVAVAV